MDPETKFNGYVLTATVAVMFLGVSVLAGALASLSPFSKAAGIAAGILASAGTYLRGTLHYVYNANVLSKNVPQDGLGFFCMIRKGPNAPAHRLEGYSADLIDGYRSPSFD